MSLETWLAFMVASWLISLSPGAGAVYAMSCGLNHGFARGCVGIIGLVLGIWTVLALVAIGLGALLAASAPAFRVVKWAGVAYLVWLGVRQWRATRGSLGIDPEAGARGLRSVVARGWAINATNPKGLLFILAVVPQFLDASRPLAPQYLAIGATLGLTDLVVMSGYTAIAARVLALLRKPRQVRLLNRGFGAMFVGAAALLAGFHRS